MEKIWSHLLSFFLGIATVFALGFYSAHDLRYFLSPALHFANGSSYKGPLDENGLLSGYGKLSWSNGDKYEGEFVNGLMDGKGRFTTSYVTYEGQFHQGYMEGAGKAVYSNGNRYEGNFKKDSFDGKGKLINSDGSIYEGDFLNNEVQGEGHWIYADKSSYTGGLKKGVFHGRGTWVLANGTEYIGDFVNGKMQGHGDYKYAEGEAEYSGEFVNNDFSGAGKYKDEDGTLYEGTFSHWSLEGRGIKTDKEGNVWKGSFKSSMLDGEGSYNGKNGVTYIGGFKYGSYDGKGKLREKNGDIYEGEFKHGEKDGVGLLTYAQPQDGVKQVRGRWDYDRLVEGDETTKIFSAKDVAEYAIYHQLKELDHQLDAVHASDPGKVELYSLVVAAYGTQEVFRRESKFIKNLFATQYHNQTTSIYLTNSQRSLDEDPLATLTGIRDSILRLSEQMDKDKDIFFLYITSHGSKDKKISLTHNGLTLGSIDSKWLGDILKSTGIKHKVIVLSACYSGGFIDDLKDDNSIIMTSADANHTSFGCSDDNQFTYFAKAYFKESLAASGNFVDAFYKAKDLVGQWEKSEKQTPSNPQIYIASPIETDIKNWRTVH